MGLGEGSTGWLVGFAVRVGRRGLYALCSRRGTEPLAAADIAELALVDKSMD
jgi:hypothetical protein